MLFGERADGPIGASAGGVPYFAAVHAAELDVDRTLRFERSDPLESAALQDCRLQGELRRKSRLDLLGARRGAALVVDQRRAAGTQNIDSIGPRGQGERAIGEGEG